MYCFIWIFFSCWYEVVHVILLPYVIPSVHLSCSCHGIYMYEFNFQQSHFLPLDVTQCQTKLSSEEGNGYIKCDNSSWLNTYHIRHMYTLKFIFRHYGVWPGSICSPVISRRILLVIDLRCTLSGSDDDHWWWWPRWYLPRHRKPAGPT